MGRELEECKKDLSRLEADRAAVRKEAREAAERMGAMQSELDEERRAAGRHGGQVAHLEERLAEERNRWVLGQIFFFGKMLGIDCFAPVLPDVWRRRGA